MAAEAVGKVLGSAVANAVHNDGLDAEDLYVSACYADEATTLKRWRPRARGRATRIRKRTCHVTVIVSRMDDERLARRRAERDATQARRSRRVTESRRRADLSGRLTRRRASQAEAEAVSYTHLDVYKRQVLARAGGQESSKDLAKVLASGMTRAQAATIEQQAEIWYQQHQPPARPNPGR